MVQLEAVLSDGPDITDADWAEIEALGTAPASDESASGAESETA